MLKFYKKIKSKIISISWNTDWEDEYKILNQLVFLRNQKSDDSIYDSIFQFKAQVYTLSFFQKSLLWLISFFGFWFLVFKYFFVSIKKSDFKNYAYFFKDHINYNDDANFKGEFIKPGLGKLLFKDLLFIFEILFKTKFNFSLISISVYRIAQIRYAKSKYNVNEVWTDLEYSSSCGIIKKYCSNLKIKLKNFMHGDKVLTIRDSFSVFDEFIVWDEHYIKIFNQLNVKAKFTIKRPWKDEKICNFSHNKSICYFLKGIESKEEVENLNNLFEILNSNGYKISIKEHPRNRTNTNKYKGVEIIDINSNIEEIFENFEFISAQYSTVLLRAYLKGAKCLIDDISNPKLTNSLIKRKYIMYNKENLNFKISCFLTNLND